MRLTERAVLESELIFIRYLVPRSHITIVDYVLTGEFKGVWGSKISKAGLLSLIICYLAILIGRMVASLAENTRKPSFNQTP